MNLSFYEAIQRIPLGIAVALELLGPLTVALAGSRRRLDLAWIVLAIAGIVLLTHVGGHSLNNFGIVLALLAGCCWGAYIVLNARLGRSTQRGSLALGMCFAAVFVLPFGIAQAGGSLLSDEALAVGAAVGVLSTAIPYSLELEALRRIEPHVFGVMMSLEPAAAALAGLLVLGQHLGARELLGIALVIAASMGASRAREDAPVAL
jgi:inner membrane transporter RhtA